MPLQNLIGIKFLQAIFDDSQSDTVFGGDGQLRDQFNRDIHYLRLSVTDRCDFRCNYCLPRSHRGFAIPKTWMMPDELARITKVFSQLGVRHIRLTGGEPLVRAELPDIARRLHALPGIEDLALSTNASRLAKFAGELYDAGVSRLNISLDSLRPAVFEQLTGGKLHKVLAGIDAAIATGFAPIKINMVVMRDINDLEVSDMVDFCRERGLTLRFIETMPVGSAGRDAQNHYLPLSVIEDRLRQSHALTSAAMKGSGPARYFRVDDSELRIGFITPQSQHFCETCNRVRLGVTGDLYLCLGQENKIELGRMLRAGADDEQLKQAIIDGIQHKPERHEFLTAPTAILRPMSQLGG